MPGHICTIGPVTESSSNSRSLPMSSTATQEQTNKLIKIRAVVEMIVCPAVKRP